METTNSPLGGSAKRGVVALDDLKIQTEEIAEYAWFDPEKILSMKPNIETWDFYIEILEKIIGDEELGE
jgi:NADH pyrophosphatase NudC (nudix superfamily)